MRWWLLALALVALLSLTFTLLHPSSPTLGSNLLAAIDRDANTPPTPARGAIQLIDFTPDPTMLRSIPTALWTHGDGALPTTGLPSRANSHWIRGPNVEFTWQFPSARPDAPIIDPLRAALVPPSRAESSVRFAMAGQLQQIVESTIADAQTDLAHLTDEQLFQAWLKADRALLAETSDLHDAARQILLLKARPILGPVMVFGTLDRTYIVPAEPLIYIAPSNDAYAELDTYDHAGHICWSGRLRIMSTSDHPLDADRVRLVAARITQFVSELSAPASSAPAGIPGGFQFPHQSP